APALFEDAGGARSFYDVGVGVHRAIESADDLVDKSLSQVFGQAAQRRDIAPEIHASLQRTLAAESGAARPAGEQTIEALRRTPVGAPSGPASGDIRSQVLFPTGVAPRTFSKSTVEAYQQFDELQRSIATGEKMMLDRRTGRTTRVPMS